MVATKALAANHYNLSPSAYVETVSPAQHRDIQKRNLHRFPSDFMFQLTREETPSLRSQTVTLNRGRGKHGKYLPHAFTQEGIAMLSSVLRSERAVQVNIGIMRAFVRLRALAASHQDLARRLDDLERKYDKQFKVVFDAIRSLVEPPPQPQKKVGFRAQ